MKRIVFKLDPGAGELDSLLAELPFDKPEPLPDSQSNRRGPLFSRWTRQELDALEQRAQLQDPYYARVDLGAWHVVPCHDTDTSRIMDRLWSDKRVSHVAVESAPSPSPPPREAALTTSVHRYLGHLAPAPMGISIRAAHARPGGRGEGQQLIDIEQGWCLTHKVLASHAVPPAIIGDEVPAWKPHGTGTLAIVAGRRPRGRLLGIVPSLARLRVASVVLSCGPEQFSIATALLEALRHVDPGDVLMLQVQIGGGLKDSYLTRTPAEADAVVFQVVRCATALGVTVVAAAGNDGCDLDDFSDKTRGKLFNRDVRDSLAVIVGAADPPAMGRQKESNYGARIDCFAWGEGVVTACAANGCDRNNEYRFNFDGTSAATAIVAGAAAAVQGVARARFGRRYGPRQLRQLLSDRTPGRNTPSAQPDVDKIGVMPNLAWILDKLPEPWIRPWEGP
jgi:hypothetical protein